MKRIDVRKITYSAIFLVLSLVLPFFTGQIAGIGSMLCPMHIPVLLCGFVCGWQWGLVVGLIAPLLRSMLFGMPMLFPTAVAMMFELAAYGFVAGILYRTLPKKRVFTYVSLIIAMIIGRIVWGIAQWILLSSVGKTFTMELFISGAVVTAIPGIILHIVLVPVLVMSMERAGLMINEVRQ